MFVTLECFDVYSIKVIYLVDEVFSDRDFYRFGFDRFIKHDILVECWSFRFFNYVENSIIESVELNTRKINVKSFKSFSELEYCIDSLPGSFVFDKRARSYGKYTASWFQNNGAVLVDGMQGEVPLFKYKPRLKDKLVLLDWSVTSLFVKIKNKIESFIKNVDGDSVTYDIRVCGGLSYKTNAKYIIEAHSLDYDIYLASKCLPYTGRKYAVFLDSGMVEHPDFSIHNTRPACTHDNYYPSINSFFQNIEDELSIPVVIALHPKTDINKGSLVFLGRDVKINETHELIRDCSMVIAHDSTAISFAVLWEKPLLIVTTDEIEKNHYMSMEATSKALGIKRINIDHLVGDYDWNALSKEPMKKYSDYKRIYIKAKGTPEKNSWEIFIDEVDQYISLKKQGIV